MQTIAEVLQNAPVDVISHDKAGIYVLQFFGISTPISFLIYKTGDGRFDCDASHHIKPEGFTTAYRSSHTVEASKVLALKKALRDMARSYRSAVNNGHRPNSDWFVPNDAWPDKLSQFNEHRLHY